MRHTQEIAAGRSRLEPASRGGEAEPRRLSSQAVQQLGRALRRAGIATLDELQACSPRQLRRLRGIGPSNVALVAELLQDADSSVLSRLFAPLPAVVPTGPRSLTTRERLVLLLRYDIVRGTVRRPYRTVAQYLGVSEVRAGQIRASALEKLGAMLAARCSGRTLPEEAEVDMVAFERLLTVRLAGRLR